jgi:hypothetical protein
MQVNWSEIKAVIDSKNLSAQYVTVGDNYWIKAFDGMFEVECLIPTDPTHADTIDFEANYKPTANAPLKTNVITAFEENDKRLKCARGEATYASNECTISFQVPTGGRWIAGGSAFTDAFYPGDYVHTCQLVDVDNILGYGANTVLANYEDQDITSTMQGWYFEPDANNTGFIEIEPIGGYAFIYEGLYLVLNFTKHPSSTATKVFVNVWWGKEE